MMRKSWQRWVVAVAIAWALLGCPVDPDSGYDGPPLDKPVVEFTAEPVSGTAPLTVQFTDKSYITNDLPLRSWRWLFGDGKSSLERHPEHVYEEAGVYTVSLAVAVTGTLNSKTEKDYITVSGSATEETEEDDDAE